MTGVTRSAHKQRSSEGLVNTDNETPEKRPRGRPKKNTETTNDDDNQKLAAQNDNDKSWLREPQLNDQMSEEDLLVFVLSSVISQQRYKRRFINYLRQEQMLQFDTLLTATHHDFENALIHIPLHDRTEEPDVRGQSIRFSHMDLKQIRLTIHWLRSHLTKNIIVDGSSTNRNYK